MTLAILIFEKLMSFPLTFEESLTAIPTKEFSIMRFTISESEFSPTEIALSLTFVIDNSEFIFSKFIPFET